MRSVFFSMNFSLFILCIFYFGDIFVIIITLRILLSYPVVAMKDIKLFRHPNTVE